MNRIEQLKAERAEIARRRELVDAAHDFTTAASLHNALKRYDALIGEAERRAQLELDAPQPVEQRRRPRSSSK